MSVFKGRMPKIPLGPLFRGLGKRSKKIDARFQYNHEGVLMGTVTVTGRRNGQRELSEAEVQSLCTYVERNGLSSLRDKLCSLTTAVCVGGPREDIEEGGRKRS